MRVAHEVGDLVERRVELAAQSGVGTDLVQGLAHAQHPRVAGGGVDGEALVTAPQHRRAVLGAVQAAAAHPFGQVLDQHRAGLREVGLVHRADRGGFGMAIHRAIERVDDPHDSVMAADSHVVPVAVDRGGFRFHAVCHCNHRTNAARVPPSTCPHRGNALHDACIEGLPACRERPALSGSEQIPRSPGKARK